MRCHIIETFEYDGTPAKDCPRAIARVCPGCEVTQYVAGHDHARRGERRGKCRRCTNHIFNILSLFPPNVCLPPSHRRPCKATRGEPARCKGRGHLYVEVRAVRRGLEGALVVSGGENLVAAVAGPGRGPSSSSLMEGEVGKRAGVVHVQGPLTCVS
jgi:hypothetical protein